MRLFRHICIAVFLFVLPLAAQTINPGTQIRWPQTCTAGLVYEPSNNTCIAGGGGSGSFGSITSGTNTSAAMVVGSGATIDTSGTGDIKIAGTELCREDGTSCANSLGGIPTVVAGLAAGTGASVGISPGGRDGAMRVNLTGGSSATPTGVIFTVTFGGNPRSGVCVQNAVGSTLALESFISPATTGFVTGISAGSPGVVPSQNYVWEIVCPGFVDGNSSGVSQIIAGDSSIVVTPSSGIGVVTLTATGGGGSGSVTSVGMTVPSRQTVSGSPVTTSGTLAVTDNAQAANTFFSGPTSGAAATPSFRVINASDVPTLNQNTSGTASNLSGTPALPNGTTATTQTVGDNSTKIATDAFVLANEGTGCIAGSISYTGLMCPFMDAPNTNLFITNSNPTATSNNNVLMGINAGIHLANGSSGVGAQADVYIGANAGTAATTAREDVFIGSNACSAVTGNNTGPDDMVGVCIGSNSGDGLTNSGGSFVVIGQKALENSLDANQDVYIGTHVGTGIQHSGNNVIVGDRIFDDVSTNTSTLDDSVFIGAGAVNTPVAGSTILQDIVIGKGAGSILGNQQDNVIVGWEAGESITTGSQNVCIGSVSCYSGPVTPTTMTGSDNVVLGFQAGSSIQGGAANFVALTRGPVNGGNDVFIGALAGNNALNGTGNMFIGDGSGQNASSGTSHAVAIGEASGGSAPSGQTSVGFASCNTATGSGNTCIGDQAGRRFTSGQNNTLVGESAGISLTGAESNNVAVGSGADFAAGVSNSIQIGPGTNSASNTAVFFGNLFMNTSTGAIFGPSITDSGLTPGNCVQAGTGGLLTTGTGIPCFLPFQDTAIACTITALNTPCDGTITYPGSTIGGPPIVQMNSGVADTFYICTVTSSSGSGFSYSLIQIAGTVSTPTVAYTIFGHN